VTGGEYKDVGYIKDDAAVDSSGLSVGPAEAENYAYLSMPATTIYGEIEITRSGSSSVIKSHEGLHVINYYSVHVVSTTSSSLSPKGLSKGHNSISTNAEHERE
jgi:hypothetical protein